MFEMRSSLRRREGQARGAFGGSVPKEVCIPEGSITQPSLVPELRGGS